MMSLALAHAWKTLSPGLSELRAKWPMRGWTWDTRFNCISSSFATHLADEARHAAELAFPVRWTSATIKKAPARVLDLAERTGGVRDGQQVLTAGDPDRLFAYGLWWPWGGGVNVSLRVGLAELEAEDEPYPQFRTLFGVSM
jgi:hypothetical protein